MKLRRLVPAAALVVALALALAFGLAPKDLHLEGEATMRSNTATVGPYVSDLREWHGWTTWLDGAFDPAAKTDYAGKVPGVGEAVSWSGGRIGHGRIEITSVDDQGGMVYRGDVDGFSGTGRVSVEAAAGDEVKVHWLFDGVAPAWNLPARLRRGAIERRFDGWMKDSLAHLADLSEHTLRPPGRLPKETVVKIDPGARK